MTYFLKIPSPSERPKSEKIGISLSEIYHPHLAWALGSWGGKKVAFKNRHRHVARIHTWHRLEMRSKTYANASCHLSLRNLVQMKQTQIFHILSPVSWIHLCLYPMVYPTSCPLSCARVAFCREDKQNVNLVETKSKQLPLRLSPTCSTLFPLNCASHLICPPLPSLDILF